MNEIIRGMIANPQQSAVQAFIQEQCAAIAAEYGYLLARVEEACRKVCVAHVEACNATLSLLRSGDPQLRSEFEKVYGARE
jgi:hypothetical protein